jgi:hypothetical protein
MPNFTQIRPAGAEFFHSKQRTIMTQLTVAFHNFPNASEARAHRPAQTVRYSPILKKKKLQHFDTFYIKSPALNLKTILSDALELVEAVIKMAARMEGQTDMTKLLRSFLQGFFCK